MTSPSASIRNPLSVQERRDRGWARLVDFRVRMFVLEMLDYRAGGDAMLTAKRLFMHRLLEIKTKIEK